jgi:hypothetical protein
VPIYFGHRVADMAEPPNGRDGRLRRCVWSRLFEEDPPTKGTALGVMVSASLWRRKGLVQNPDGCELRSELAG